MRLERGWLIWAGMSALAVACATGSELDANDGPVVLEELDGAIADARAREPATPPKGRDASADGAPPDPGVVDGSSTEEDGGEPPVDAAPDVSTPLPPALLYVHSANTLYRYEGTTLTRIGAIGGIGDEEAIDLAIDRNGLAYLTTFDGFYRIDLATAAATRIRAGAYPNSLSFLPVGTLDANQEALVAYSASTYIRIDPATGAITNVGALGSGYMVSGDIVSVAGGGTFVTVTPSGCDDCVDNLVRIDPRTGAIQRDYGTLNIADVYGVAYWAGALYGFAGNGVAFTLTWNGTQMTRTNLVLPSPTVLWYGAGSTTTAPVRDAAGNGPPLD